MERLRTYGRAPFEIVVVHGGPGAAGEMAPVARVIADCRGVLEPMQTGASIGAQVEALRRDVEREGDPPVALVGFSWGAWLSMIVAARYPALVSTLVLVGSGPLEQSYASKVQQTRMRRLTSRERLALEEHAAGLVDPDETNRRDHLAQLGALARKTDTYDPIPDATDGGASVALSPEIYRSIWPEAARLRQEGELVRIAANLRCPVVAIHGDYDPHPAEGVREPLTRAVKDLTWVLLEKCGHRPWAERQARDKFFRVLRDALC